MRSRLIRAAAIAVGLYLMCGLVVSSSLAYAVPATSLGGRAYLTVLWLPWVLQRPLHYRMPVPAWAFDFSRWQR